MRTDSNTRRIWYSGRWERRISGEKSLTPAEASRMIDQLFTSIAPREIFTESSLTDLKGRDEGNVLLKSWGKRELPERGELIFLAGYSSHPDNQITYRYQTDFEQFEGPSVRHKVRQVRSRSMPLFLKPKLFGFIAPFTITQFRFALERFTSQFKAFSLGYVPEVTERVLIDFNGGELKVVVKGEALTTKEELPFSDSELGEKLVRQLEEL